jgi:two-component system, LytTR family, response regulator
MCRHNRTDLHANKIKNGNMLKAIIIDDEEHCIETLLWNLNQNWKADVEVIATATNPIEGLKLVNAQKPDILFLDIEMPHLNGLDLAEMIQHQSTNVVFTTAYDQYAIKAIKLSALDYLLKPVDEEELGEVIEKLKEQNKTDFKSQINNLREAQKTKVPNKIALSNMNGFTLVAFEDIVFVKGENSYSDFKLINGRKVLVSKTMSIIEEILDPTIFFRVHKSYIVNLHHVASYIKNDGGDLIMDDGTKISVARNRKDAFLAFFDCS